MKNMKKMFIVTLATLLFMSPFVLPMSVFAEESQNGTESYLSASVESIADKYIYFDTNSSMFKIDTKGLSERLSQTDYEKVLLQVNNTNEMIAKTIKENNLVVSAIDSTGNTIVLKEILTRKNGKTDIEFHWNYARIYIDGNNVRLAVQAGFIIAGVNIPAKVVATVCGLLGLAAGEIKDGIWFDYNYFIGMLCGNFGLQ